MPFPLDPAKSYDKGVYVKTLTERFKGLVWRVTWADSRLRIDADSMTLYPTWDVSNQAYKLEPACLVCFFGTSEECPFIRLEEIVVAKVVLETILPTCTLCKIKDADWYLPFFRAHSPKTNHPICEDCLMIVNQCKSCVKLLHEVDSFLACGRMSRSDAKRRAKLTPKQLAERPWHPSTHASSKQLRKYTFPHDALQQQQKNVQKVVLHHIHKESL